MGNCQAAKAAAVLIQHPNGTIERVYWSISASHVMASNPGHYVAVIITVPHPFSKNITGEASRGSGGGGGYRLVKHLKLLRPDDTLLIGQVYRLVSFEEVVRKVETKRNAKLSKYVENSDKEKSSSRNIRENENENNQDEKRTDGGEIEKEESENSLEQFLKTGAPEAENDEKKDDDEETDELVSIAQELIRRAGTRPNQWRPALHTISEVTGSST